jgi:hypothetical protein
MGWLYKHGATRRDIIEDVTAPQSNDAGHKWTTLKRRAVGNNLWAVIEHAYPEGNTERYIMLFKLAKSGDGWGYKDIGESCGPYEDNCPLSFFDLAPLADDDDSYARAWRDRVRQAHARRNQKLTVGQEVKLTNGQTVRITHRYPLRGVINVDGYERLYRIPRTMLTLPERAEQSAA